MYDFTNVKFNYTSSKYGPGAWEEAMIRFKLASVLRRKGWTPYRLSQETGLTVPTAYRLADPDMEFGRFTVETLDSICAALKVQPGELIQWVPNGRPRRKN